jgi:hypothetical protein
MKTIKASGKDVNNDGCIHCPSCGECNVFLEEVPTGPVRIEIDCWFCKSFDHPSKSVVEWNR